MSDLSSIGQYANVTSYASTQNTSDSRLRDKGKAPEMGSLAREDIVEISELAYMKSISHSAEKSAEERQALADQIREQLQKLSSERKDLNSHIQAVLKENGIKLSPSDKLRLETSGGKIYAGGIKDKEVRKAVEDALNKENGLFDKLSRFKATESKASSILKSETGATLDELAQASIGKDAKKGDVTSHLLGSTELDQYSLFEDNPDLVELVRENAEPSIVLNSASRANAEPEKTLTEGLEKAWRKIDGIFNDINDAFVEKLKGTSALRDPDFDKDFLMKLGRVKITVNSDGGIEITGKVADDSVTDRKGKEIIENALREMMGATDDSGEAVPFAEATQRIMDDYQLEYGGEAATDAVVEMEIGAGAARPGGAVRLASPTKEAELLKGVTGEVNTLLADMGIESDEVFAIEIGDDSTVSVANLPEDGLEREKVLQALEVINAAVKTGNEDDETYGRLVRLLKHDSLFNWGGTHALGKNNEETTEVTNTDY